ncbi:MAG: hypothetical protein ACHQ6T_08300 [Myxococcota bacterium]
MRRAFPIAACVALCAVAVALPARVRAAEPAGGCTSFEWPLEVERGWLGAAKLETLQSGATLPAIPQQAFSVALNHSASAALPVSPSGKPHGEARDTYAGTVAIAEVAEPGLYQVTLSGPGWIDVIQGGAPLAARAHTSSADCPNLRKSVRFQLAKGRAILELSSVPGTEIAFAIRRAD